MFYHPRFLHRLYAALRGHFWIPCPLCKRHFGRHEWRCGDELWITDRDTVAVCPRCGDEARRRNEDDGYPRLRHGSVPDEPRPG